MVDQKRDTVRANMMQTLSRNSGVSPCELGDKLVHEFHVIFEPIGVFVEDVDIPGVFMSCGIFFACVPAVSDEHCIGHCDEVDGVVLIGVWLVCIRWVMVSL